jgi:hypothetical protein
VTAFLNFVAKLPPGLAKPLAEVAGAMLILQKTGVVSVGIKLTGLAAGASGAGAAAGPFAAAGAAIAGGILLEIRRDLAKGWKTAVSDLPKLLEGVGSILNFSASGWANTILDHFAKPVRKMWDDLGHFLASSFDITRHQVARAWAVMTSDITTVFDIAKEGIRVIWDKIKILFLQGEDFIVRTMGKLPGPLGAPFRAAHVSIQQSLAAIQRDVGSATRNIQADWDRIHGKTVRVNFVGSGSGSIAFKESIPGVTTGPSSQGLLGFHAAGGKITGGTPGRDSVLGMLMPGEVVVPTRMVQAGAVDHLRGQLPGFASGGMITGMGASNRITGSGEPFMANTEARFGRAVEGAFARAVIAKFKKDAAAAANPFAGITGVPSGGPIGAGAAAAQAYARSILFAYGWGQNQFPPLQALWNGESGWRWNALNASSGAYGIPQSLPASKMASAGADWRTNPATQIRWGLGYIKAVYGSPANTYARWLARSPHWYGKGGLVPGYASGGTVTPAERKGQTYLNAWRSRHGGGFGAAHGPVVLNEQIPRMQAAIGRAATLSHAPGLSPGKHRFWASAAADEKRRLAVLKSELGIERVWRGQLGATDATLARDIAAAGNLPGLRGNVRSWKAQMAAHKYTIGQISGMLGYSDAYIKAHPPAPVLPKITHTYGGDVANNLGVVLAAALGPFTGAARGGMVFDRGGTLRPGWNPVYNGTGRPEPLVPARGGGGKLQIEWVGGNGGDDLERWIRKNVRIRGGGNVQKAYGAH